MKIFKDTLFHFAQQGRLTLQIPDIMIETRKGVKPEYEYEEVPDDWVVYLKDNRPVFSNEKSGIPFLTRKGYEENKDKLREKFNANLRGHTWEEFEDAAELHFDIVKKATEKYKNKLKKQLEELEKF